MKPVKQTKLASPEGISLGNCLAACLASMLEIPLWMVPPFEEMYARPDWRERIDKWLARMFVVRRAFNSGHQVDQLPEYYVAHGLSPRGVQHAVIYRRGFLVHDPHPSDTGIAEVEETWHLEPIPD
jgi:hypothetical protein